MSESEDIYGPNGILQRIDDLERSLEELTARIYDPRSWCGLCRTPTMEDIPGEPLPRKASSRRKCATCTAIATIYTEPF